MPIVEVDDIYFHYPRAVLGPGDEGWTLRGISLEVRAGSTLGIVGESGSGKSTLVRVMCGLLRHQRGTVRFDGRDLAEFRGDRLDRTASEEPDRVPEPAPLARPQDDCPPLAVGAGAGIAGSPTRRRRAGRRARAGGSASRPARAVPAPTLRRPAAEDRHRAVPWRSTPRSSTPTSPSARSTCPCRRRCSTS